MDQERDRDSTFRRWAPLINTMAQWCATLCAERDLGDQCSSFRPDNPLRAPKLRDGMQPSALRPAGGLVGSLRDMIRPSLRLRHMSTEVRWKFSDHYGCRSSLLRPGLAPYRSAQYTLADNDFSYWPTSSLATNRRYRRSLMLSGCSTKASSLMIGTSSEEWKGDRDGPGEGKGCGSSADKRISSPPVHPAAEEAVYDEENQDNRDDDDQEEQLL